MPITSPILRRGLIYFLPVAVAGRPVLPQGDARRRRERPPRRLLAQRRRHRGESSASSCRATRRRERGSGAATGSSRSPDGRSGSSPTTTWSRSSFRRGEPVPVVVDRAGQRITLTLAPGIAGLLGRDLLLDLLVAIAYVALGLVASGRPGTTSGPGCSTSTRWPWPRSSSLPSEPVNRAHDRPLVDGRASTSSPVSRWAPRSTSRRSYRSARTGSGSGPGWCRSSTHRRRRRREHGDRDHRRDPGRAASRGRSSQAEFLLLDLGLPFWATTLVADPGRALPPPSAARRAAAGGAGAARPAALDVRRLLPRRPADSSGCPPSPCRRRSGRSCCSPFRSRSSSRSSATSSSTSSWSSARACSTAP